MTRLAAVDMQISKRSSETEIGALKDGDLVLLRAVFRGWEERHRGHGLAKRVATLEALGLKIDGHVIVNQFPVPIEVFGAQIVEVTHTEFKEGDPVGWELKSGTQVGRYGRVLSIDGDYVVVKPLDDGEDAAPLVLTKSKVRRALRPEKT